MDPLVPDKDLLDIHQAVLRELPEPTEGREKGPWWLWVLILFSLFGGGFYLGRYGGVFFENKVHVGYLTASSTESSPKNSPNAGTLQQKAVSQQIQPTDGKKIFSTHCQSCHQESGVGIPGVFPSLVKSTWVIQDAETVVRILLYGLQGPIEVQGETYNGVMPAWKDILQPSEIAAVSSYIRSTWGNSGSLVHESLVKELRLQHGERGAWSAQELIDAKK